jgi:hypothetical protein
MEPNEALGIAAQVAVTLAGFAGVVVVFRPQALHQWSALDKFRLQLLLTNSVLPLAYSLLGMLLLTVHPPIASIWRWCSGVAFVLQILLIVFGGNPARRIPGGQLHGVNKVLFYGIAALGTAAMALQAVYFAKWNWFWPFFAFIFVHLVAAVVQFMRMVLLVPERE